jgi:hypothetical protein
MLVPPEDACGAYIGFVGPASKVSLIFDVVKLRVVALMRSQ